MIVVMISVGWLGLAHATSEDDDRYAKDDVWLCRPGRSDACTAALDATVIAADGGLTRERYQASHDAKIDCFYVYPTVSTQSTANSDFTITAAEERVVQAQFARFGSKCRAFAPMYRQVTLAALRAAISGRPMWVDRELGYGDVRDAWNHYLRFDNQGRGFVLIGQSQGSGVLTRLIKEEIDGKPVQARLVSAILMGTSLPTPRGADVGGGFQHSAVCRSNSQTGCVIAFAIFRSTTPPPENSRFGKAPGGMQAVCANPAALAGGSGILDAYLSTATASRGDGETKAFPWTEPPQPIDTPFVKVPGLLSAACVSDEHGSYLAATLHPTPGGVRTNEIPGDVMVGGKILQDWGLHLIDANLTMGNLLAAVAEESKTHLGSIRR